MQKTLVREMLPVIRQREWQRFRGWTLKILEDLEHSGGKTTRAISDATGCRCVVCTTILGRMLNQNLVERVESWGWRITRDGITLLLLQYNNTTTTQQQHNNNTNTI